MLSEKALRHELSRYPKLIKRAVKDRDIPTLVELYYNMATIEWVLSDED